MSLVSVDFDFNSDIRFFFRRIYVGKNSAADWLAERFSADIRRTKIRQLIQIFGGGLESTPDNSRGHFLLEILTPEKSGAPVKCSLLGTFLVHPPPPKKSPGHSPVKDPPKCQLIVTVSGLFVTFADKL